MLSWAADPAVARLADGHYSRQKPGSDQFSPPGRKLVLKTAEVDPETGLPWAAWVTSWPFPQYVNREWKTAWLNALFVRRGGAHLASALIRWGVAHTRAKWPEVPPDGFITMVDPAKIAAKTGHYRTRGTGWCYLKAGWRHVGFTKGGLWVFQQLPAEMPPAEAVVGSTLGLFTEVAS